MGKFHISEDGVVRPCEAATPATCKAKGVGGMGNAEHFDSHEEAQARSEEIMNGEYGQFSTVVGGKSSSLSTPRKTPILNFGGEMIKDKKKTMMFKAKRPSQMNSAFKSMMMKGAVPAEDPKISAMFAA